MDRHLNGGILDWVQKAGLLPLLRKTRSVVRSDVSRWIADGCPSPAPAVVKMAIVNSYVRRSGAKVFVETGTLIGGTVEYVARQNRNIQCFSIEINKDYFDRAERILGGIQNIKFVLGDSGKVIPELLQGLNEPAVFWLDGHYSGGATGKGDIDTPISAEMEAIISHRIKGHTILIDDAREFSGHDYPILSSFLAAFDTQPDYQAEVSADIIRVTPRI